MRAFVTAVLSAVFALAAFGVDDSLVEVLKKAEQGDAIAQFNLGRAYSRGVGVHEDDVEAAQWFRKAAEQGNADAQCNLGAAYALGEGVPKNHAEAANWYRKAAEQGDTGAQYFLGAAYVFGKGVPKDYVEAYKWLDLAAESGMDYAAKRRLEVAAEMTKEQIAEAQRLSSAFVPRPEEP